MKMPLVNGNISRTDVLEQLLLSGNISFLGCDGRKPPPETLMHPYGTNNNQMTTVAVIYSILFFVGVCGNSSVLSIVLYMKRILRKQTATDKENVFIFFIALCSVDSMVILSMPMTISYFLLGHWLFGIFACRFYWLMESVGKIMSTFVLASWGFERYVAVCHPTKRKLRRTTTTSLILGVLALLALVLLVPLPYSARVNAVPVKVPRLTFSGMSFYVEKCSTSGMSETLFSAFTVYIFILGYCIPLTLMVLFYSRVLLRVRGQKQALTQSKIPLKRVTSYTVALISFYFLCYTPYWVGTLLSLFVDDFITNNFRVYVMYAVHALPYVNSSFNFVFYALLNSQLRNKRREVVTALSRSRLNSAPSSDRLKIKVDGKSLNESFWEAGIGYTPLRHRTSTLSPWDRSFSRKFTSLSAPVNENTFGKANTAKTCDTLSDCVNL